MFLVFDTETTGLPRSWNAPASHVENWPRLVQLAWETYDGRGNKTGASSYIIRPQGFVIPAKATQIHGISNSMAQRSGRPIRDVLEEFRLAIKDEIVVVSHNIRFDENIVQAEYHRLGLGTVFDRKARICIMTSSTDYCRIPGSHGYKWPTLSELHGVLFGKACDEMHDAAVDVAICSKCFFELKKRGIVRIRSEKGV